MSGATFSYVADRGFMRRVAAASLTRRSRQLNLVVGALSGLTAYALVAQRWWLAVACGVGGLVALPLALAAQRPARDVHNALRAQFAGLPQPPQITVDVGDAGFRFTNANGSQDVPWTHIASVHTTRAIWFVHTVEGTSLPLPAHAVSSEAAAVITAHAPKVTSGDAPVRATP